ncbi:DNA/RNA nuclease SfsA [Marinobacter sp. X15-166B]|uniref:DNA/RNA nuclease SfsA n=1 Tax=Marinobacter sp. X15-166B TaxID=1897620 RepID=UPI00085C6161|nr:DNA/RNA nuclease SfsA [Marinobacter sp. X15-166B]OEY66517.1 sugar fermentation stimulation protein SfsA [Marinobacter sp. X15-166B]
MQLSARLVEGRLLKRYKRFLADVQLADGSVVTAHCPNTGSMRGCQPDNARVWLTTNDNPKRKLRYTWELVEVASGHVACINTARPNGQVGEAIEAGVIGELAGYATRRSEVRYGSENSRIDWLLSGHESQPDAWVEVKNVTLAEIAGAHSVPQGYFPDAVTVRGQKHLRELMAQVAAGGRAVLCFCVNHTGIEVVRPADHIDPAYGQLLREAAAAGVEVLAYRADDLADGSLRLRTPVPVILAS